MKFVCITWTKTFIWLTINKVDETQLYRKETDNIETSNIQNPRVGPKSYAIVLKVTGLLFLISIVLPSIFTFFLHNYEN